MRQLEVRPLEIATLGRTPASEMLLSPPSRRNRRRIRDALSGRSNRKHAQSHGQTQDGIHDHGNQAGVRGCSRRRTMTSLMRYGGSLRIVTLATSALLITFGPLSSRTRALSPVYGMVTHYVDAPMGDKMVELGAGLVRVDFNWYQIEPSPNSYDFSSTDATVQNARARGLYVFATLAYTPGWANGGLGSAYPPSNIQDWYNFVYSVVQHYQGTGMDVWQFGIWNEPNLSNFWQGSIWQYEDMVTTGSSAIRAANPGATVLAPEVSFHGVYTGFFNQVMSDVGSSIDIQTVHWYPDANNAISVFMDQYVYQTVSRTGKSVWLTEVGQTTCSNPTGESQQADLYTTVLNAFQPRRGWWTSVFFYDLYEGVDCAYPPIRPDWSNRPAFTRYQQFIVSNP
jgi:hypothetical protein